MGNAQDQVCVVRKVKINYRPLVQKGKLAGAKESC